MKNLKLLPYFLWLEVKRVIFSKKYFAEIDITDNCNLRCRHCYHFHGKTDFKSQELPLSVWEKRFRDLHKSGVRAVMLVGGEPALRPDVLMLADKVFPIVYVITNGTIKVPDDFNHRLFVSVDGTPKTNDFIRGKNSFTRLMENYSKDKRVIINMTLTSNNYKELEEVTAIAEKNGFDGVVCNICSGVIDCDSNLFMDDRTNLIHEMRRVKELYPKLFLMTKSMIKWYEKPDHTKWCAWGSETLHLDVFWKKRRCFTNNADCSNCGCFAGAFQTPLKMIKNLNTMIKIATLR
ncbi:MAG: radical SAM protein [Candidatus Bathyarchaeota archaeon]|nr:radical SAM protein [Candidatus Bathyarchaeota archaeon]